MEDGRPDSWSQNKMAESTKKNEWEEAYKRGENFLFYPSEEVLRFLARRVAIRAGLSQIRYADGYTTGGKALDFGCGIGRHVKLLDEFGFDSYGVDLSEHAIETGRNWLAGAGLSRTDERLLQADGRKLPFQDETFVLAVSHGVLDSMPFEIAKACMTEIRRVLQPGALFYLDLISNDDSDLEPGFRGEVTVSKPHELGTIQSYFDTDKIDELLAGKFGIVEKIHVQRKDVSAGSRGSRYHLVVRRL